MLVNEESPGSVMEAAEILRCAFDRLPVKSSSLLFKGKANALGLQENK